MSAGGTVECEHPDDGVMWNPWNKVVQCHRCGHVVEVDWAEEAHRLAGGATVPGGTVEPWLRRYGPHATRINRQLRAKVRQFVGGKTWSLCLITKIDQKP